jgi:hypothetical protein
MISVAGNDDRKLGFDGAPGKGRLAASHAIATGVIEALRKRSEHEIAFFEQRNFRVGRTQQDRGTFDQCLQ